MTDRTIRQLRPEAVVLLYEDGDGHGWHREFQWLRENHASRLEALWDDMRAHGQREPIRVGPDGRVWDGHHRLCVALSHGVLHLDVEFL